VQAGIKYILVIGDFLNYFVVFNGGNFKYWLKKYIENKTSIWLNS